MKLLALDLSLTATGWALSRDGAIKHGVQTSGDLRGVERLARLQEWLAGLLVGLQPDVVLIEGYAFGARGRAIFNIGEWGGVCRLSLFRQGIPFVEVPPAVLKKWATGSGKAPKGDMRMALYKRSGLDLRDDNEVDALWLLAAGLEAAGTPAWQMPKAQIEALDKVKWPALAKRPADG